MPAPDDLSLPASREDWHRQFSALQQRALDAAVALRPPPPEPASCCGRGCNGCVWEGFYSAAACWREEALLHLQGM
ncbi:oxidoreductase-like domain-containing protein [Polaromonas sp.]|uniref:oxidoreductase-like domain-containing protein n=1 Tax=Polaromonas sp. TaxID=1869339 RepID=UPI0013B5D1BF|nr:oxidoreductase-like domain-containing protein [Polaromonas sp.]NDP64506.1 oxidoreductase [Polaromonas sp.]